MRARALAFMAVPALLWTSVAIIHAQEQPKAPTETDTAVATEIEHKLSVDPEVNAQTIEIDVRGGVVTLTGRVIAEDAKERAEKLAATVPGVRDVRNEISVSGAGARGEQAPGPIPEQMPGAQ